MLREIMEDYRDLLELELTPESIEEALMESVPDNLKGFTSVKDMFDKVL